jgi:DNA-binding transcriptional ArsR family regulator
LRAAKRASASWRKSPALSQSALSQHLARLRRQNLVKTRRQAQTIFYSLDGDEVARIIGALHGIFAETKAASSLGTDGAGHGSAAYG